jgi:hypothetical protein
VTIPNALWVWGPGASASKHADKYLDNAKFEIAFLKKTELEKKQILTKNCHQDINPIKKFPEANSQAIFHSL